MGYWLGRRIYHIRGRASLHYAFCWVANGRDDGSVDVPVYFSLCNLVGIFTHLAQIGPLITSLLFNDI